MKRILVAVDGSKNGRRAAEMAVSIARDSGARLGAVIVIDLPRAAETAYVPWQEILDASRRWARETLGEVSTMAEKAGVPVGTEVLEGHIPTRILKYAESGKFDMVVVGSRGLSRTGRLLLGSVSTALAHHAKMSVLVVK